MSRKEISPKNNMRVAHILSWLCCLVFGLFNLAGIQNIRSGAPFRGPAMCGVCLFAIGFLLIIYPLMYRDAKRAGLLPHPVRAFLVGYIPLVVTAIGIVSSWIILL